MPDHKKKKRSRSRSRSREDGYKKRKEERKDERLDRMQRQIDGLTKAISQLVDFHQQKNVVKNVQYEHSQNVIEKERPSIQKENLVDVQQEHNLQSHTASENVQDDINIIDDENKENVPGLDPSLDVPTPSECALKLLGVDPDEIKPIDIVYHPELKNTWLRWKMEGLPEKNKKDILSLYNRKGDFYTEAPKLNLEIIPLLSEITTKRDQHFVDTQNCVGLAMTALAAAVSMLLDPPEEGLDESVFADYISHAGQILSDVFYQQSIARRSFITPQLNKNIKPVIENAISNEWLYGDNLKEKVKDMKEIEKACGDIKERPVQKNTIKFRDQGNARRPPANYRQVGHQFKQKFIKFQPRTRAYPRTTQRPTTRTTSRSSSKK